MNPHTYIVIGLVVFDLLLLTGFYFYLWSHVPLARRILFPVAGGLIGFAIQALLFFSVALLYVQLGTIAGILGLCCLASVRPRKGRS